MLHCYGVFLWKGNGQEVNSSTVNEVNVNTGHAAISAASLWYQGWTVEFYKPWKTTAVCVGGGGGGHEL